MLEVIALLALLDRESREHVRQPLDHSPLLSGNLREDGPWEALEAPSDPQQARDGVGGIDAFLPATFRTVFCLMVVKGWLGHACHVSRACAGVSTIRISPWLPYAVSLVQTCHQSPETRLRICLQIARQSCGPGPPT